MLRAFHRPLQPARFSLAHAAGLIVREEIRSDRPYPPIDRVCMDGIAIRYDAWRSGRRKFNVAGMARVGEPRKILEGASACMEVATGSPCPEGADTVVPYEKLALAMGAAEIFPDSAVSLGQNICAAGTDCPAGSVLVRVGACLTPPCIGAAASFGATRLWVTPRPRVALLGTGDELVGIADAPEPWQLRRSNAMALWALIASHAEVRLMRAGDDPDELERAIAAGLEDSDMLVMTGGVSAGRFDAGPRALSASGIQCVFHKLAIRPGKPIWFGLAPGGRPVFALPGNPVASLVCARRFALPMLLAMAGFREVPARRKVRLGAEAAGSATLACFVPVRLAGSARGVPIAYPVSIRGSGDFPGLAASDGFIETQQGLQAMAAGATASYYPWSADKAAA